MKRPRSSLYSNKNYILLHIFELLKMNRFAGFVFILWICKLLSMTMSNKLNNCSGQNNALKEHKYFIYTCKRHAPIYIQVGRQTLHSVSMHTIFVRSDWIRLNLRKKRVIKKQNRHSSCLLLYKRRFWSFKCHLWIVFFQHSMGHT
jgi:hypothetical protein